MIHAALKSPLTIDRRHSAHGAVRPWRMEDPRQSPDQPGRSPLAPIPEPQPVLPTPELHRHCRP